MGELKKIWERVTLKLKEYVANNDVYTSYIAVNVPVSISDTTLVLSVGEPFLKDWLENNYRSMIEDAICAETGKKLNVEWVISNNNEAKGEAIEPIISSKTPVPTQVKPRPIPRIKNCIGVLNPDFTFDEFVVGPSNALTHSAAKAVAQNPGTAYNPLFIYGDTGLGKTHLMQAVGHEMLKAGKKVAYVTTETLLNEYTDAIIHNTTLEFRNKYRKVDLMLIDDIQFFAGKPGVQEEFFHTFNALYQDKKQIIITSDKPASEVSGLEKRLVSRFNAGLSVEMESPNFEMRLAILRYKQSHSQDNIKLSEEEEIYIAQNVKSNVRTLEGAMNKALAYKRLTPGDAFSLDTLRFILRELTSEEPEEKLTPAQIRKAVSEFYNVDVDDLNKESRLATIVTPRQVAMYLCRVLTENSLPMIAKVFERTHANIYHACTKIQKQYQSDEKLHQEIVVILGKLNVNPSVLEQ